MNKIRQLAALAESDYLISEYYDWRSRQAPGTKFASPNADADKRKAAEGFAHSKAYAREAIDLSPLPDRARSRRGRVQCAAFVYLLKEGERQTIIDYLERAAQGRDEAPRKVMLASAAAIRDGRMPEHYQQLLAIGSL